jgi:hypothetical protein
MERTAQASVESRTVADTINAWLQHVRTPVRSDVSETGVAAGLSNSMAGSHTSKTMMLRELRALLAAVPGAASYNEYAAAVIDGNVLDKATSATRAKTLLHLRHLYTLDGNVPIFAALRELWPKDADAQPAIALLCAAARDPLLRATAEYVLDAPLGTLITPDDLALQVAQAFPGRYRDLTAHHVGQNTGSSWNQAGYLEGRVKKYRVRPAATAMALALALYLGHLEGRAGPAVFDTLWVRIVGGDDVWVRDTTAELGRAGWVDYASSGGMLDIRFSYLDSLTARA